MVTGCTGGIGEGFALVLASRGFNVLLVSRSESKLKELAATIKSKYPKVQTDYVVSDATSRDVTNITSVISATADKNLTIVVNNVGVSNDMPMSYESTNDVDIENMIAVNCRYGALLTNKLITVMKKTTKTSSTRGAIINLSSQSAYMHVPYLAIYSATKAFNLAHSNAIRDELKEDNIDVLALTPGFVATAMTRMKSNVEVRCKRAHSILL